jgi:transposase-like protein
MPITANHPFKGRQHPGELIILCVRWYLRYPLSYEHVTELMSERGVEVDASCIWRWVQAYAPELNKRCRPHLKPVNKSYRIDETYIKVKGEDKYLYRGVSRMQVKTCRAVPKMGEGLPESTFRSWLQTTRSCCVQKAWW